MNLTGQNSGLVAHVVHLGPFAPFAASGADSQSVLDAYCEAMAAVGAPVVKPETILTGIHSALKAGYSPRMVLIGLGMWEGEGFRSPRQVEEWIQKAARQDEEPQNPASAADLLAEVGKVLGARVEGGIARLEDGGDEELLAERGVGHATGL